MASPGSASPGSRDDVADSATTLADRVRAETEPAAGARVRVLAARARAGGGQWADAAVVGSALVQVVADHGRAADLASQVERYVRWLQS